MKLTSDESSFHFTFNHYFVGNSGKLYAVETQTGKSMELTEESLELQIKVHQAALAFLRAKRNDMTKKELLGG